MQSGKPVMMAALIVLGLAACSDTSSAGEQAEAQGSRPEAGAEPVRLASAAEAAATSNGDRAKDEVEARAFIDRLFTGYATDEPFDLFGEPRKVFEPQLAAAVEAAMAEFDRTGEMPDIAGADPICACQDWGDFSHTINILTINGDRAIAKLTVSNFGARSARTVELLKTAEGWRVYDLDGTFRKDAM
jgi:hypothetical protein